MHRKYQPIHLRDGDGVIYKGRLGTAKYNDEEGRFEFIDRIPLTTVNIRVHPKDRLIAHDGRSCGCMKVNHEVLVLAARA